MALPARDKRIFWTGGVRDEAFVAIILFEGLVISFVANHAPKSMISLLNIDMADLTRIAKAKLGACNVTRRQGGCT